MNSGKKINDKLKAYQSRLMDGQREQVRHRREMSPGGHKNMPQEEPWLTYFQQRINEYAKSEVEKYNIEILGFSWSK